MALFDIITMTEEEMHVVRAKLADPVVMKYLKALAVNSSIDLAVAHERVMSEDADTYKVKNAFIHGAIEAINDIVTEAENHPQPK